jgi:TldD protein
MTDTTSQYTDARGLLYRDGMLDPDGAKRVTAAALRNCDDGELYLQYRATESFGFDDGRLKTADYSTEKGFGLRGVSGEMTGFAHANEISEAAINRAAQTLALLDPARQSPAPPPARTNRHLYTEANPLELVPFAEKVALCAKIDAEARAKDPRVAQVSVSLAGSWSVIDIVRADGFTASDIRPLVRLNVSVIMEDNGRRETGVHGCGGRYLYDGVLEEATWRRAIDEALKQAETNLRSVDAPAGEMTGATRPWLVRRAAARGGGAWA